MNKDAILEAMGETDDFASLEDQGVNLDELADTMLTVITLKVDSVEVDGDTAVVNAKFNYPDFANDKATEILQQATADVMGEADFTSQSKDELKAEIFQKAMTAALTNPDFPMEADDFALDYVKDGDTWKMKDQEGVEEMLNGMTLS